MSRLQAFIKAPWRTDDPAPPPAAEADVRASVPAGDLPASEPERDVFGLIPPPPSELPGPEPEAAPEQEAPPPSRNIHPISISDLSRLSIDNDGRLYWDGKPVEVRRRLMMSRAQIIAACVIGAFVIIGAVGAAIQGSAVMHDWACRLGWTTQYCTLPDAGPPRHTDIPA